MRRAVLVSFLALSGCGSTSVSQRPDIVVVPLARTNDVPPRDAEDRDRALRRRVRGRVQDRPALQRLPRLERHLAIDIAGVSSDGRLLLLVRSDLGRAAAGRAYRAFLTRAGDDGRSYVPSFRATR